jgi:hypothetical protein
VTALDWPTLRALIEGEHVAGVVAAVNGLDDRQRRALAGPVGAYARERSPDPSASWEARQRGTAALRVAGAGCLSGADAVARWLTRADLRSWGPGAGADDAVLEVLRARGVPWLPELARRLAGRQRADRWDGGMWRLVAALVAATGIEPPATDWFVLGWTWACGGWQGAGAGRRLVEVLRHDPFLTALAPRLFEVDGVGGVFAWSASAGAPAEASWPRALATLAAEGRLERAMLLDRCLGRLLRGGRRADVRGFLLLHQALDPDLEEVAARARDYARLLADGHANVAAAAQQALRRADDAGRLELGLLLEASRAVLFRPENRLVRTQLSWLDAVARRRPGRAGEVLGAASVAFGHERAELQARAVSLIGRHARHADPAARAELLGAAAALPADLRQRVAAALGGEVPADGPGPASWPAPPAPTPRELPPPIGTPAELAEELAAVLVRHAAVDPVALERLLAALVTLAHADPAALRDALDPVVTRYHVRQGLMLWSPTVRYEVPDEHLELRWAAAAAVARPGGRHALRGAADALWNAEERNWHCALSMVPAPRRVLLGRLHELAVGLRRPPPLLLATPTAATGQLDPGELVARLERTVAAGCEPWEHDLQQAMLRLPPGPHAAAADRARRLGSPAGRRLAGWLATGGLPHPGVARRVHTTRRRRPYWPPSAPPVVDEVVSLLATVTPPPDLPALAGAARPRRPLARRLRPGRPPLARLLCELPAPEHWQRREAGWLECWPAVLPCHRDVVAAHLLPWLGRLPGGAGGAGRVLPLLAEADGPAGPGLTIALAHGLGARDQTDRAAAVDALLVLAGRGQLDGAALGAELGALSGLDVVQVGRVAPALRDLARAGAAAEVWAIVAAAIPGMLPPARERPPRGLPDLMAVGAEVAGAGGGAAIPELATVTGRAGSSRLVDASRRLERVLAGTPAPG